MDLVLDKSATVENGASQHTQDAPWVPDDATLMQALGIGVAAAGVGLIGAFLAGGVMKLIAAVVGSVAGVLLAAAPWLAALAGIAVVASQTGR